MTRGNFLNVGQSVTLTMADIQTHLGPILVQILKDNAVDIVHDRNFPVIRFSNKSPAELLKMWCELYSDTFFNQNPSVTDVLFLKEVTADGIKIKEWVASR